MAACYDNHIIDVTFPPVYTYIQMKHTQNVHELASRKNTKKIHCVKYTNVIECCNQDLLSMQRKTADSTN